MQITAAEMEPSFTRLHSQLLGLLRAMTNVQLKKKEGLSPFLAPLLFFPCTEPDIQLYSHPKLFSDVFQVSEDSKHLSKVLLCKPSKANRLLNIMVNKHFRCKCENQKAPLRN